MIVKKRYKNENEKDFENEISLVFIVFFSRIQQSSTVVIRLFHFGKSIIR